MKNKQETTLWKMLRRVSDRIVIQLDNHFLDEASMIETFSYKGIDIHFNIEEQTLSINKGKEVRTVKSKLLIQQPSLVFKEVLSLFD
jgi:uncharacterized protein